MHDAIPEPDRDASQDAGCRGMTVTSGGVVPLPDTCVRPSIHPSTSILLTGTAHAFLCPAALTDQTVSTSTLTRMVHAVAVGVFSEHDDAIARPRPQSSE